MLALCEVSSLYRIKVKQHFTDTEENSGGLIMSYEKLSKKAIGCMYVGSFIGTIIVVGILAGLLYWLIPEDLLIVRYIMIGLIAFLIANFLLGPMVRYNRYCYSINEEAIDVKEGFVYIERQIVPIERLHNIEISKGPINRIFGLSEVKVTTAGSTVSIKFLEDKQAEFIVQSLQKRINTVALEKKIANIDKAETQKEDLDVKTQAETECIELNLKAKDEIINTINLEENVNIDAAKED